MPRGKLGFSAVSATAPLSLAFSTQTTVCAAAIPRAQRRRRTLLAQRSKGPALRVFTFTLRTALTRKACGLVVVVAHRRRPTFIRTVSRGTGHWTTILMATEEPAVSP